MTADEIRKIPLPENVSNLTEIASGCVLLCAFLREIAAQLAEMNNLTRSVTGNYDGHKVIQTVTRQV